MNQISVISVKEHLEEGTRAQLSELINAGIMEKVKEATEWCATSYFLPKKSDGIRLITDFRQLNRNVNIVGWQWNSSHKV